jgi:hypothetical protein
LTISTQNAPIGTHTLPIFASATFPQNTTVNLLGEKRIFSNPTESIIPISSNLTITVEYPPPWYQSILDVLNILSNPLTGIATAISIISTILGLNYWKKKRSNRRITKKQSDKRSNGKDLKVD